LLWEVDQPAAGIASPSIYQVKGKQFIVIACGESCVLDSISDLLKKEKKTNKVFNQHLDILIKQISSMKPIPPIVFSTTPADFNLK